MSDPSTSHATPYKLPRLVLAPSFTDGRFDSVAVDAPFVFRHASGAGEPEWWMTYVGWDRRGYRTGLARSRDLLTWTREGLILDRGPLGSTTQHNAALTSIVRDNELRGPSTLTRVRGRFLGTYHAYPDAGYEAGPAAIGLCWSDDLRHWTVDEPVLRAEDGAAWERAGLYKSWLLEHDGTFYMFYNAKDVGEWPWREQTGLATSTDLVHWRRHPANPLVRNGPAGSPDFFFASDPCVLRDGGRWVMFHFGLAEDGHTRELAAYSDDLVHWSQPREVLIDVGGPGAIDQQHAHKPAMAWHEGHLYHFYCAVRNEPTPAVDGQPHTEMRGIAVASSRRLA